MIGALTTSQCAIYDPVSNSWSAAANMLNGRSNDETWTLLPDQTVVTCECPGHPVDPDRRHASDLVEASSIEIGPAITLPNGRLFAAHIDVQLPFSRR